MPQDRPNDRRQTKSNCYRRGRLLGASRMILFAIVSGVVPIVQGYRLRKYITPAEITRINRENVVPRAFITSNASIPAAQPLNRTTTPGEGPGNSPSEITPGFSFRVFLIPAGHLGDKSRSPLIEVFVESFGLYDRPRAILSGPHSDGLGGFFLRYISDV